MGSQICDQEVHAISLDSKQECQIDPQSSNGEPQAFISHDSSKATVPISSDTCSDEKDGHMNLPPDTSEQRENVVQKDDGKLSIACERNGRQDGMDASNKAAISHEAQVNPCLLYL